MDPIKVVEEAYKKEMPPFRVGDTISVSVRVKEGEKERVQTFTGICIGRRGSGTRGVEKVFPLHSPLIEKIKVMKEGVVRRAKLYYLRDKKGKAAKVKEKIFTGKK
jgi:large subunit ribosomal protein L19